MAAQVGGSLLTSGAQSLIFNAIDAQRNKGINKELMYYQYLLNQQGIDAQNRYNSPLAQMDRLTAAGLNPNLVYGHGVDGNQSSSASAGLSSARFYNTPDLGANLARFAEARNQTKVSDATAEKLLADKQLTQARYLDIMLDVAKKDRTLDTEVEQAKANLRKTNQSIAEGEARTNKITEETNNILIQRDELVARAKYMEAHAENERVYVPQVLKERARNLASSTELNEEQKKVARTIASLNEKKLEYLEQQIKDLIFVTGSDALDFKVKKMMDEFGASGLKPKDFFDFLLKLFQVAFK